MSDQIDNEHSRILQSYREALEKIAALKDTEIAQLVASEIGGHRFHVRHAVSDAARIILDTEIKLKVFDNLLWSTSRDQ